MLRLLMGLLLAVALAACSRGPGSTAAPGGSAASPGGVGAPSASSAGGGGGGGGGPGTAAALAAAAKDACSLMPVDAVKAILPKAAAPAPEPEPFRCSMGDGTGVVEISFDATSLTSLETLNPCEPVSGVGVSACLQEQTTDDAYLQVLASSDPIAIVYVEVAGHDGKSHRDDAINVAKAVLAKAGG